MPALTYLAVLVDLSVPLWLLSSDLGKSRSFLNILLPQETHWYGGTAEDCLRPLRCVSQNKMLMVQVLIFLWKMTGRVCKCQGYPEHPTRHRELFCMQRMLLDCEYFPLLLYLPSWKSIERQNISVESPMGWGWVSMLDGFYFVNFSWQRARRKKHFNECFLFIQKEVVLIGAFKLPPS